MNGTSHSVTRAIDLMPPRMTMAVRMTRPIPAVYVAAPNLACRASATELACTMLPMPNGVTWSWQFDVTQSGNNLTLNGASVEFDFAADGVFEQAKLNMALVRQ
jgi:hypothetical protein